MSATVSLAVVVGVLALTVLALWRGRAVARRRLRVRAPRDLGSTLARARAKQQHRTR